ncbi:type VII secretion protein EccE [Mycobacterium sp. CVI_P3]|uniref:Type VII secretion protein EccE n=1 Tax=Mycobacterium pinniadriaticum TaxID=2994102 RepID=A0ABT3SKD9_9MYCO|nr:type VII secretion protein EccE [Mycobacterium pinniadriaticum]MCX2933415.1 type VII secretion protein EccE [Mycobacterium pinniadriaticum]MCX2939837.1 type VII secretion protein EccE [Mycobacterium pinniadriaticum]
MRIVPPGTGRITLGLLIVIPMVMAYPWHAVWHRWALGITAVVVVVLLGWWRGLHLTTILGRRLGLTLRSGRGRDVPQVAERSGTDARTTVVLRVVDCGAREVPFDLLAGYLDRYGVRCESLRVTSRDTVAGRATWIAMTMSARANLSALQARSSAIPLRQTAELAARRLADELREYGWMVTTADLNIPDLLGPRATEGWRAVTDGPTGHVAAYGIDGPSIPEALTALWSRGSGELWTSIELSRRGVAAACAIRTPEPPEAAPPVAGLLPRPGVQWRALCALIPTSTRPLDADVFKVDGQIAARWIPNGAVVGT